jgi:hypothetical protein
LGGEKWNVERAVNQLIRAAIVKRSSHAKEQKCGVKMAITTTAAHYASQKTQTQ